jgi:class 3 adenylate cyclase
MAKNPDEALVHARAALDIAARTGDRDLMALQVMEQGRLLIGKGELAEGLALIDEATVAAVSAELSPLTTGAIYCNAIDICRRLVDHRRAAEWTDAAQRWCERQRILGFPGACRVYRAGILRVRGALIDALTEAARACDEMRPYNLGVTAEAFYELGETRLRLGDLPAAEEAFRQAHELGRDPQPGLALLRLAEGKVDAARTAIRSALSDDAHDRLGRAQLLPAQVEIALASGEPEVARAAASELDAIVGVYPTPMLEASAACARGLVGLATGDHAAARQSLRAAARMWQQLEAPYETARARTWLASAYRAEGDNETATLELEAARVTFERLGADLDVARVMRLLADNARSLPAGSEPASAETRTFMFTDIVRSTQLVEAIGDEAWADLVRWHDQTLRACFASHGGEEVDHAGDGFFVAFAAPEPALACSVAIQQMLVEHRRRQGFAPQVRIGLHTSAAQRDGRSYRGRGVHIAARIAAAADAGEILASRSTVAANASTAVAVSAPRVVALKGVAETLEIVSVSWR